MNLLQRKPDNFSILFIVIICFNFLVHCGSIRQTASIISMSEECLRTGDKAIVHFRYIKQPEYLSLNQRLVFREGRTKAVGNICKLIPINSTNNLGPINNFYKHGKHMKHVPKIKSTPVA